MDIDAEFTFIVQRTDAFYVKPNKDNQVDLAEMKEKLLEVGHTEDIADTIIEEFNKHLDDHMIFTNETPDVTICRIGAVQTGVASSRNENSSQKTLVI